MTAEEIQLGDAGEHGLRSAHFGLLLTAAQTSLELDQRAKKLRILFQLGAKAGQNVLYAPDNHAHRIVTTGPATIEGGDWDLQASRPSFLPGTTSRLHKGKTEEFLARALVIYNRPQVVNLIAVGMEGTDARRISPDANHRFELVKMLAEGRFEFVAAGPELSLLAGDERVSR